MIGAIAQFAPTDNVPDNLDSIREFVAQAAAQSARLLVLPEYAMFTQPHVGPDFVASAQSTEGGFVTALAELAREHDMFIVAGVNEEIPDQQRIHNTLVALSPSQGLVAVYRKVHLYDAFGYQESSWVAPSEDLTPVTFDVDGTQVGLQTCYDLRFPEITRQLVDAGAEVVAVPAEWVPGPLKEDHWRTLVRARAIENTVYVLAADQAAPNGSGGSMIVDPMGVVAADLGERSGVACAAVVPSRIEQTRVVNPALALRRFRVSPA